MTQQEGWNPPQRVKSAGFHINTSYLGRINTRVRQSCLIVGQLSCYQAVTSYEAVAQCKSEQSICSDFEAEASWLAGFEPE